VTQKGRRTRKANRRRQPAQSPQEVLVKALNHPLRVKALTILSERTASPTEIAELLDKKLSNVAYHIRVLHELGLIEIVEEESVRGSVAHFYRAVDRPLIDNADWKQLDPKIRGAFSGHVTESFITDAANSLAAGLFDKRDDRQASRTPLLLDREGWRQVSKIQAEANEKILKVQAAATQRIDGAESKGIHAVAGIFFFEVPPDTEG
jgi:DNA-binding transcriptional ArsR family regulator